MIIHGSHVAVSCSRSYVLRNPRAFVVPFGVVSLDKYPDLERNIFNIYEFGFYLPWSYFVEMCIRARVFAEDI